MHLHSYCYAPCSCLPSPLVLEALPRCRLRRPPSAFPRFTSRAIRLVMSTTMLFSRQPTFQHSCLTPSRSLTPLVPHKGRQSALLRSCDCQCAVHTTTPKLVSLPHYLANFTNQYPSNTTHPPQVWINSLGPGMPNCTP